MSFAPLFREEKKIVKINIFFYFLSFALIIRFPFFYFVHNCNYHLKHPLNKYLRYKPSAPFITLLRVLPDRHVFVEHGIKDCIVAVTKASNPKL